MESTTKNIYYAVLCGRQRGVYTSWVNCQAQIDGWMRSSYKVFVTLNEAQTALVESSINPIPAGELFSAVQLNFFFFFASDNFMMATQ